MEYPYGNGYIYMRVKMPEEALPDTVRIGEKTLVRKSSFHVSLVCVKEISTLYAELGKKDDEELAHEVLAKFAEYLKTNPVTLTGFRNEFRYAIRDEKESLVICCDTKNLTQFFDQLNAEYATRIPYQPTHVTLYTLQPDIGIGISSPEQMSSYEKVDLPEIAAALGAV